MVRPVDITDALSKSQQVGRLLSSAMTRPEESDEFQKALAEKVKIHQKNSPNPIDQTDKVVLHVDEKEEEKRKRAQDQEFELAGQDKKGGESQEKSEEPVEKNDEDEDHPSQHIDIKA